MLDHPACLVSLKNVEKRYPILGGVLKRPIGNVNVLNGIDLILNKEKITGLVGESGCGKSTLAKLLIKLEEPTSGQIEFDGVPLNAIRGSAKKTYYRRVQMIFQDPFASLNPRMKVKNIIGEMIRIQGTRKVEEREKVLRILNDVELEADSMNRYPHEFSGGQRQRIAIARALIVEPELLIADEPVSALDLSLQAKTMKLLASLKSKRQFTIFIISHDLKKIAEFCDDVSVMYLGKIVESMPGNQLLTNCRHPYTKALIDSLPTTDPSRRKIVGQVISGEVPSPINLPTGCAFHGRCPKRLDICDKIVPPSRRITDRSQVACHLYETDPADKTDHA